MNKPLIFGQTNFSLIIFVYSFAFQLHKRNPLTCDVNHDRIFFLSWINQLCYLGKVSRTRKLLECAIVIEQSFMSASVVSHNLHMNKRLLWELRNIQDNNTTNERNIVKAKVFYAWIFFATNYAGAKVFSDELLIKFVWLKRCLHSWKRLFHHQAQAHCVVSLSLEVFLPMPSHALVLLTLMCTRWNRKQKSNTYAKHECQQRKRFTTRCVARTPVSRTPT